MPVKKFDMDRLIALLAAKAKISQITKETGLSRPTIEKYRKQLSKQIKEKEMQLKGNEYDEEEDDNEEEEELDPVLANAVPKFINDAGTNTKKEMTKYFSEALKGGMTLLRYQNQYLSSLETMGVKWDEFIDFALKTGYEMVLDKYLDEKEKLRVAENDLKLQIEDKLEKEGDNDEW